MRPIFFNLYFCGDNKNKLYHGTNSGVHINRFRFLCIMYAIYFESLCCVSVHFA